MGLLWCSIEPTEETWPVLTQSTWLSWNYVMLLLRVISLLKSNNRVIFLNQNEAIDFIQGKKIAFLVWKWTTVSTKTPLIPLKCSFYLYRWPPLPQHSLGRSICTVRLFIVPYMLCGYIHYKSIKADYWFWCGSEKAGGPWRVLMSGHEQEGPWERQFKELEREP